MQINHRKYSLAALFAAVSILLTACTGSGTARGETFVKAAVREDALLPEKAEDYASCAEYLLTQKAWKNNGEVSSATATGLELRLLWEAEKLPGNAFAKVTVSCRLEYQAPFSVDEKTLTLAFGTETKKLTTPAITETGSGARSLSVAEETWLIPTASLAAPVKTVAVWDYNGTYQTADYHGASVTVTLQEITATALVTTDDRYDSLPEQALLEVTNIMQQPELPNGCEITSLTILLNYLGFGVDKLTMADTYLPKNEDTFTSDFYETFAGNPRNQSRSLGCYAPVIVKAASDFLAARGGDKGYAPYDLTGASPEELYRQISLGNPVVLWMTQYINTAPAILRSWTAYNGRIMNWKHPLHCVVLIGYDQAAGTVTIADPLEGIVTHDMSLFALRYLQLGTQAVIVTDTPSDAA